MIPFALKDIAEQLVVFALAVGFMVLIVVGALVYGAWTVLSLTGDDEDLA